MFDPGNHDYPYGENTKLGALHAVSEQRYPTSGISTPMSINLAQECAPFACLRVMSVRTIGAVEVEGIRLGKPALIPGI
jgi:hypothetical protein